MKKLNRTAVLAACAITTMGMVPATAIANAAPPVGETVAFPAAGKYIAEMPGQNGMATTTMAITVNGDNVAAYATNGATDETYFSGMEHDGSIDLNSVYQDHLQGAFNGTTVDGTLTMNDVAVPFTASAVTSPAGMYTSEIGDARASWVVRPDQSMVGMENTMSRQASEMRVDRQLEPAPKMTYGTWHVDMNGTPTTATAVTGSTTF
jgi:hypothetical protein